MKSYKTIGEDGHVYYKTKKGNIHRENGPAYQSSSGLKVWWINGKRHREDGPAVVFSDGTGWYYLNGREYTKEEWEVEVVKLKLKRIKDL